MSITTRVPYGFELEAMPLEAFGGVGGHRRTPIAAGINSIKPQGGGAKKTLGIVVGVAAAVAAPYLVPALAGAIGASVAIGTTASMVAAGAVYGATAGAASALVGGGNVGRSALIGGALGGAGGYFAAPGAGDVGYAPFGQSAGGPAAGLSTGAAGAAAPSPTAPAGPAAVTSPVAPPTATGATALTPTGGMSPMDIQSAFVETPAFTEAALRGAETASLGAQLSSSAVQPGLSGMSPEEFQSAFVETPAYTESAVRTAGLTPSSYTTAAGTPAGTAAAPTTSQNWASTFGKSLTDRVTDPRLAAETVLRAAGQLAGSAAAGSGLSAEQQELVNMQMEELRQLREQNQAAFNQRLESASAILGEVAYFDPEYFGLQRARQQQIAGARAKRTGLRGLTGEARAAEARRFDLETGRNIGTAYDQGFLTGVQGRMQTRQAGLSAMPQPSAYATSYQTPYNMYSQAEQQRLQAAQGVGNMFGDIYGYNNSRSRG